MRVLALLLALGPPEAGTPGESSSRSGSRPELPDGAIAIHWRMGDGEAPTEVPGAALESDLREGLAALDGRPAVTIRDRALVRARRAVSRELPASVRSIHAEARAALDDADAAFRDGRFVDARAALATSLDLLEHNPELPGVAAMVRETRLVEAAIAWAEGDRPAADLALSAGLAVDPEALLSTRSAPPGLVDRYRTLQTELLDSRSTWIQPAVGDDADLEFVIDGVPGLRPLPLGEHFVAVHRDGHEPVGLTVRADEVWSIPAAAERIPDLDPDEQAQAELLCQTLDLELLVLAERRGERLGLQAHRCGSGFGPAWFGEPERLALGIAVIVGIDRSDPFDEDQSSLRGAWPDIVDVRPPDREPTDQPKRPWYRKGWVWGTTAGVAALVGGAIATGVVLGRRSDGRSVSVDANDFIGN